LDVTEAEIEDTEMRRREFYQRREDHWIEQKILLFAIVFAIFIFVANWVWGAGCNSDVAFLAPSARVSLRATECGGSPADPTHWAVTVDHQVRMLLQNMVIPGIEGMWIPLGDYYRLHPGDNLIEYRAVKAGFVDGPTESIVLTLGEDIPLPTMGAYTITEILGEGN